MSLRREIWITSNGRPIISKLVNNRDKKLHLFTCKICGYKSNDDRIGATNLYRMGINYLERNVEKYE